MPKKEVVFIGPSQSGKTTAAYGICSDVCFYRRRSFGTFPVRESSHEFDVVTLPAYSRDTCAWYTTTEMGGNIKAYFFFVTKAQLLEDDPYSYHSTVDYAAQKAKQGIPVILVLSVFNDEDFDDADYSEKINVLKQKINARDEYYIFSAKSRRDIKTLFQAINDVVAAPIKLTKKHNDIFFQPGINPHIKDMHNYHLFNDPRYTPIWNGTEGDTLASVTALFRDYCGSSGWSLAFSGHPNRHHARDVRQILDKGKFKTAGQLIQLIEGCEPQAGGSLIKRIIFANYMMFQEGYIEPDVVVEEAPEDVAAAEAAAADLEAARNRRQGQIV